jgi:hypothetical protein
MPLKVSTTSPTHDITLTIDDEPVRAHIKRLSKDEGFAFFREFTRLGRQRGNGEVSDEELTRREQAAQTFIESSIVANVAFEPATASATRGRSSLARRSLRRSASVST